MTPHAPIALACTRARAAALFAFVVLLPSAAPAQTIDTAADLTAFIQSEMTAENIPGALVYASRAGEVVYHQALGLASTEDQTPMTKQTLTLLASVSKPVTGVALLTLIDDGKIALDDPINDYLPFAIVHPGHQGVDITPRMLLTHQSGIVDSDQEFDVEGDSPTALSTFIRDLLTPGGQHYTDDTFGGEPGTTTRYSNDGIALMGYLVEVVSKMPFEAYSQQALFEPLGMDRTSWFLSGLSGQPIAFPHVREGNAYETLPHPGFPDYPAGQLRTSVGQLARFLQMIQNGGSLGGERILEAATVSAMLTPATQNTGGEGDDQGFVWYRAERSGRVAWEHNGSVEGITTLATMLTDDDVNVIVLTNGEEVVIDGIVGAVAVFALEATTTSTDERTAPATLDVGSATPNPFSDASRITLRVAHAQPVRVSLHDVLGRELSVLHDGPVDGTMTLTLDGATLSAGVYVVRAQSRTESAVQVISRVR